MRGPHGHIVPRPDGAKARCGGPALCASCRGEAAAEAAKAPAAVPVPVLEALASDLENQADAIFAGSCIEVKIETLRYCARQLREAITKGGQG